MRFRIEYPTGYMELIAGRFFPCTRRGAKIVFGLINQWCGEEQKRLLYEYLADMAVDYLLDGKPRLYRRALMNINYLEKGVGGKWNTDYITISSMR